MPVNLVSDKAYLLQNSFATIPNQYTGIFPDNALLTQTVFGFVPTTYVGLFSDIATMNQIANGGNIAYYPEYTETDEGTYDFIPVTCSNITTSAPISNQNMTITFVLSNPNNFVVPFGLVLDFGVLGTKTIIGGLIANANNVEILTSIVLTGIVGSYTFSWVGSCVGNKTINIIVPIEITSNKTSVSFDFNDNVKIDWGDGNISQGGGSPTLSVVNYTHTYTTVPQTLLVYNFVDNNIEFIATNEQWTWDAEISGIKFNNAKLQIASLNIPNTLDNNFNLDIRNVDMFNFGQLTISNIRTLNAENSNINGKIFINDTLRILTSINVKNTPNLTFIGDAYFGGGLRLWQYGNPRHILDYLDFSGSKLEQTGAGLSTMFLPFNNLRPENIIGDMYNVEKIHIGYNDFGNASTYFDFTNYTNTLKSIYLNNNSMTQVQVDEYCKRIRDHAVAKNVSNGYFSINNNIAPSATGATYVSTLQSKGWTVLTD